jgi:hypothetical protein
VTTARFGPDDNAFYTTAVVAAQPSLRHDGMITGSLEKDAGVVLWATDFSPLRLADVSAATHSVIIAEDVTGSADLTLTALDGPFSTESTWLNYPGTTGTAVTVPVASPLAGTQVDFDVTAIVAGGAPYGWQVTRSDPGAPVKILLGSSFTDVDYTFAGAKGQGLSPNGIVGVSKPMLSGFAKDAIYCRVQIDPSSSGFGSPAWESNTQPINKPQYDLATSTFPGLAILPQWWREATQPPGGGWSDWSDPIQVQFIALLVVTINGPTDAYPYVTDNSPTFPWTTTGGTQVAYRVFVVSKTDGRTLLWDSGRIVGTEHQITMPARYPDGPKKGQLILKDRLPYTVKVQVWDDVEGRVAVPGADVFAQAAQDFTFTEVPGVPPVDYCLATQVSTSPMIRVDFGRLAGIADKWLVWWDEQLHDEVDPADLVSDGAGGWSYFIWAASAYTEHSVYVEAVVNGSASVPGPRATITTRVEGVWLQDKTRGIQVVVADESWDLTASDQATVSQALGQRNKTRRTDAVGYLEGTLSGVLADDPDTGRTAVSYEHDLTAIKAQPALPVTVFVGNKSFLAIISNVTVGPDPNRLDPFQTYCKMYVEQQVDLLIVSEPPPPSDPTNPDPDFIETYAGFADSHVLSGSDSTGIAFSGTPTVHPTPAIYTAGEKVFSNGSVTRALLNAVSGTISGIGVITSNTLASPSSLLKLKNPGGIGTIPAEIRLRNKGTIDLKAYDGSVPATMRLEWQKNVNWRIDVAWNWVSDPSLGASMGWLTVDVWAYFGAHLESAFPDADMHATYPSLSPVNWSQDSSQTSAIFTVVREWTFAFQPPPYGVLPPVPAIPAGTAVEVGLTTSSEAWVSVYCGDAAITDTISLNRSTSSSMSSPTNLALGTRGLYGWSRAHITSGLAANTPYWFQAVVNGTPVGPVAKGRTQVAAGTPTALNIAGLGCQSTAPSSPAVFNDIDTWASSVTVHAAFHHGDDGYCTDLDNGTQTHQKWLALACTDTGRGILNTLCGIIKRRSDHDTNQNNVTAPKGNNPNYHDPTSWANLQTWNAVVPVPSEDVRTQSVTVGASWCTWKVGNYVFFFADTRGQERTDVLELPKFDGTYDPGADTSATMLGATQLAALKAAVDDASLNSKLFILVCDPGWMGEAAIDPDSNKILVSNSDKWCAYRHERDIIDSYIVASYAGHGKTANAMIMHGDTHAPQNGHTLAGLLVVGVGMADQNPHALQTFVDNYDWTYPTGLGDHADRQDDMQFYYRHAFTETAGVIHYTATPRDCSPAKVGDTPVDMTLANGYPDGGVVTASWTL